MEGSKARGRCGHTSGGDGRRWPKELPEARGSRPDKLGLAHLHSCLLQPQVLAISFTREFLLKYLLRACS